MLNKQLFLQTPQIVKDALVKRGQKSEMVDIAADMLRELNAAQQGLDSARSEKKQLSAQFGRAISNKEDTVAISIAISAVDGGIADWTQQHQGLEEEAHATLSRFPNIPHTSVPVAAAGTEEPNVLIRQVGVPRVFDFEIKDHVELGALHGVLDFETAARISGARFSILHKWGARLERGLINFMLNEHTARGYNETLPPVLVNAASLFGTGQFPKFVDEVFRAETDDKKGLYLIPTAEVPVTNYNRDQIVTLPLNYVAFSPCFRAEAGAYGRDTRGLIRQHQFNKVELVKIVLPETSYDELEVMVGDAENILQKLGLPYRVMLLDATDMGFGAAKTYDLEVWVPSQNTYREISSCSNCEDFQARRMNTRFKRTSQSKTEFPHTLNGSGLAVGRTWLAIVENYQNADGSITVPDVLVPYMGTNILHK